MSKTRRAGVAAAVWVTVVALPAAADAQQLGLGQGPEIAWWRIALSLGLCIALAVGGAFALKARMGGTGRGGFGAMTTQILSHSLGLSAGQSKRLIHVETLRLTPQVQVCLFKCDERTFAVAVTSQGHLTVLDLAGTHLPKVAP